MALEDGFNVAPSTEIPLLEKGVKINDEFILKSIAVDEFSKYVQDKFEMAKSGKRNSEIKALENFLAWRGELSSEEQANIMRIEARNGYPCPKIFIKITKTKTQAAYSQLIDILLSGNKFPIGLEPTPVPEGVPEYANITDSEQSEIVDVYGYNGDGETLAPGETFYTRFKAAVSKLGKKSVNEGPSPDKSKVPQIHPAAEAARRAEKLVQDQLMESDSEFALRRLVYEQVLFGTGILKGPFNYYETKHNYEYLGNNQTNYNPEKKLVPRVQHVSFWNFYPDPGAQTIKDCEYTVERHLMTRAAIRGLRDMPFFNKDAIEAVLNSQPNHSGSEFWENYTQDNQQNQHISRYEVLEFWGFMDEELARRLDVDFDPKEVIFGQIMVNGWVCNGNILKLTINPFEPQRIPYFVVPYEEHPSQIWGIGVPENMDDVQGIMNSHMRMAVENLRLAGSLILEVNENQLKPGQEMTLYPGKIFRKQGGAPGQSIYPIQFPNVAPAHFQMFDKARQLADEATGIPSFSHGQTGVSGTGRTASGIQMLMGAAAQNIKTVVSNIDHYLLKPLGEAMYYWNMQFNSDNFQIKGDLKIVAKGTASLMQREVLTQRLITLLQVGGGNQLTAPFLNAPEILKQIAINLDLDPDKVINDPDKAMLYAQLLQQMQGMNNADGQAGGPESPTNSQPGGGGQGLNSSGANGNPATQGNGGNGIGAGNVPNPGQPTYTGNT